MTSDEGWLLPGAKRDEQSITRDWQLVNQTLIHGVVAHAVRSVPTGYGCLTEIYRADWGLDAFGVDQVFQSTLEPTCISAWHAHAITTDRLFVNRGRMLVVLYDTRPDSPTRGLLNRFRVGMERPVMLIVPPRVWHGVQCITRTSPSSLINVVDHAYSYEAPDHYRLPADSPHIPFAFAMETAGADDGA